MEGKVRRNSNITVNEWASGFLAGRGSISIQPIRIYKSQNISEALHLTMNLIALDYMRIMAHGHSKLTLTIPGITVKLA